MERKFHCRREREHISWATPALGQQLNPASLNPKFKPCKLRTQIQHPQKEKEKKKRKRGILFRNVTCTLQKHVTCTTNLTLEKEGEKEKSELQLLKKKHPIWLKFGHYKLHQLITPYKHLKGMGQKEEEVRETGTVFVNKGIYYQGEVWCQS